jgi:hypothetical protein
MSAAEDTELIEFSVSVNTISHVFPFRLYGKEKNIPNFGKYAVAL